MALGVGAAHTFTFDVGIAPDPSRREQNDHTRSAINVNNAMMQASPHWLRPNRSGRAHLVPGAALRVLGALCLAALTLGQAPCAQAASVYVSGTHEGQGSVTPYRIRPDGTLQATAQIPVGAAPAGAAIDDATGHVYVYDPDVPMIGQFALTNGALQPLQPFAAQLAGRTHQLTLRGIGGTTFAYALDLSSRLVRVGYLDAAGQLRDTAHPAAVAGPGMSVLSVHPRHLFAYVAGDHTYGGRIYQFALDPQNGRLHWMWSSFVGLGAQAPLALLIHPQFEFAYLASRQYTSITRYTIAANGQLNREDDEAPLPWTPAAVSIAGDGRFLYAGGAQDNKLAWWTVNPASGSLEVPRLQAVGGAGGLSAIAAPADLPWLYVLDAVNRRLHQFRIAADGSPQPLTPASVEVPAGSMALHVAATP